MSSLPAKTLFSAAALLVTSTLSAEIPDNLKRYHEALLRNPQSESLFDRFIDGWLEDSELSSLEETLSEKAESPSALFLLTRFYIYQGNIDRAVEAGEKIAQDAEAPAELRARALLILSGAEEKSNQLEEALNRIRFSRSLIEELEDKDPDLESELTRKEGELLFRLGRRDDGLAVWRNMLEANPEDTFIREDFIEMLSRNRIYREAIQQQLELVEHFKEDAYGRTLALIDLGKLYLRNGDQVEAIETWRTALKDTGQDTWIERESLGWIITTYRRRDNLTGLQTVLGEMIGKDPNRQALLIARAGVLTDLGEVEESMEAWAGILDANPGNRELREEYISALSKLEKHAEAVVQMKNLVAVHPQDRSLLEKLANLHHEAEQFKEAESALLEFLAKSLHEEATRLRVARTLAKWQKEERADEVFEAMLTDFPESSSVVEAYASHLFSTFRETRAVELLTSLGEEGDRTQLLRAAGILSQHFQSEAAFSLLHSRLEEFSEDIDFLSEISSSALAVDRNEEAFRWSLDHLTLVAQENRPEQTLRSISAAVRPARTLDPDLKQPLERLAERNETSPAFLCLKAELLRASGETGKAEELLRPLAKEGELLSTLTLSSLLSREQKWKEAASVLTGALDTADTSTRVSMLSRIVTYYSRASDSKSALEWTRKWRQEVPGNPIPWMREADFLLALGQSPAAMRLLREASGTFENETRIQQRLIQLYVESGLLTEAQQLLWQLYDSAEDHWMKRRWIGDLVKISQQRGNEKELIAQFEERVASNRQSIVPLLALAEVHFTMRNREQRREALASARRIDPGNLSLAHQTAVLLEEEGKYSEAVEELESVLSSDKSDRTSQKIIRLLILSGDIEAALAKLDELPSGVQPSADQILGLAQSLFALGEWKSASDFLKQKSGSFPDDRRLAYALAVALRESGETKAAITAFSDLLETSEMPDAPVGGNQRYINIGFHNHNWLNSNFGSFTPSRLTPWASHHQAATYYRRVRPLEPVFTLQPPTQIYGFGFHHSSGPPEVLIPDGPGETKAMAARHLVEIFDGFESWLIRKRLVQEGLDPKLADFALIFRTLKNNPKMEFGPLVEFFEKYPKDIDVISFLLEHAGPAFSQSGLSKEPIETAIENLTEAGRFNEAIYHANNFGLSESLLHIAEKMDSPTATVINYAGVALATGSLTDEVKSRLTRLIEEWDSTEDTETNLNQIHSALFTQLNHFSQTKQTDRWIETFFQERAKWESLQEDSASVRRQYFRPFSGNVGDPSATVLHPALLGSLSGFAAQTKRYQLPSDLAAKREAFAEKPVISFLLAQKSGNEEWLEEARILLQNVPPESSDYTNAQLLLAYEHELGEDRESAVEIVLKLQEIDRPEPEAIVLDAYLIRLVFLSEPESELKDLGLDAAKRLRDSRVLDLTVPWHEIAQILHLWGNPELAQRTASVEAANRLALSRLSTNTNVSSGFHFRSGNTYSLRSSSPSALSLPTTQSMEQQIGMALRQENKEGATEIAVRQLPFVSASLLQASQGRSLKDMARQIVSPLTQAGLVETILERTKPAIDARPIDHFRYAVILEIFGEEEAASEVYLALLEEFPGHLQLEPRHLINLAQYDPQAAFDKILQRSPNPEDWSGPGIAAVLNLLSTNLPREMEPMVKLAEALLPQLPALLENTTESQVNALADPFAIPGGYGATWLQNISNHLEQGLRFNDAHIPGIFDSRREIDESKIDAADRPILRDLRERRLRVYSKFLESMLERGDRFEFQFNRITQLAAIGKYPAEDIHTLARELAKKETSQNLFSAFNNFRNLPQRVRLPDGSWGWAVDDLSRYKATQSPLIWLIEQGESADREFVKKQIKRLTAEPNAYKPEVIQKIHALLSSTPTNFQSNIDSVRETAKESGDFPFVTPTVYRMILVQPELESAFDPGPLLMDSVEMGNANQIMQFLDEYLAKAAEGGEEALFKRLDEIETLTLKDLEPPEALVLKLIQHNKNSSNHGFGFPHNSGVSEFQTFLQIVRRMMDDPGRVLLAYRYVQKKGYGETAQFQNSNFLSRSFSSRDSLTDLLRLIESGPLLESLEFFDPLPKEDFMLSSGSGGDYLLGDFLNRLKRDFTSVEENDPRREALRKLDLRSRNTFGADLLAAALSKNPDKAILDCFVRHQEKIRSLPENKRSEVTSLGTEVIDLKLVSRSDEPEHRELLTFLFTDGGSKIRKELQALIDAESFSDLEITKPSLLLNNTVQPIQQILPWDWEIAFEAFSRISDIGDTFVSSGQIEKRNETFREQLLNYTLREAPPAELSAFLLTALADEDNLVCPSRDIASRFSQASQFQKENEAESLEAFSDFLTSLQNTLPEEANRDLLLPLFSACFNRHGQMATAAQSWLSSPRSQAEHPDFIKPVRLALEVQANRRKGLPEALQAELKALIRSDSISPSGKLYLISFVSFDISNLPETLLTSCFEALSPLAEEQHSIPPHLVQKLLSRFTSSISLPLSDLPSELQEACLRFALAYSDSTRGDDDLFDPSGPTNIRLPLNSSDASLSLFNILLRHPEKQHAARFFEATEAKLIEHPSEVYALSVAHGNYNLAETLIRNHRQEILKDKTQSQYRFDRSLEAKTQSFLAAIPWRNDEDRLTAELALVRLSNPPYSSRNPIPEEDLPTLTHEERLIELANRFPPKGIIDKTLRTAFLEPAATLSKFRASIQESLEHEAKSMSLAEVALLDEKSRKPILQILQGLIVAELASGNSETVDRFIDDLGSFGDPKEKAQFGNWLQTTVWEGFRQTDASVDLIPLWEKVVGLKLEKYTPQFLSILVYSFLKAPDNTEVMEVIRRTDPETKGSFFRYWSAGISEARRYYDRGLLSNRLPRPTSREDQHKTYLRTQELATFVEAHLFLGTESAADITTKGSDFERLSRTLLLRQGLPYDLKAEIFFHSCKLFKQEQLKPEGYNRYFWGGWSFPSELYKDVLTSYAGDDWSPVVLAALIWALEPPNDLTFDYSSNYAFRDRFDEFWAESAGILDEKRALEEILNGLAAEISTLDTPLHYEYFLMTLYEVCTSIGEPVEIIATANAAAELAEENPENPLFDLFTIAASLWIDAYEHEYLGPVPLVSRGVWKPYALEAVQNVELPLALRGEIGRHHLVRGLGHCDDELIVASAEVLAEMMNSDLTVNRYNIASVVQSFMSLPQDETWKQIARQILEGWDHQTRYEGEPKERSLDYRPDISTLGPMLQLHLLVSGPEECSQFFERHQGVLALHPEALSLLVRGGDFGSANQWIELGGFRSDVTRFNFHRTGWFAPYDGALHEKIPEFLETISRESDRWLAESLLRSVPDRSDYLHHEHQHEEAFPDHDARLTELAKKWKEASVSLEKEQEEIFYDYLLRSQSAALAVEKKLEGLMEKLASEPSLSANSNSTSAARQFFPLSAHAINQLDKGNPEALAKLIDNLIPPTETKDISRAQTTCLDHMAWRLFREMPSVLLSNSPDRIRAYREGVEKILVSWSSRATNQRNLTDLFYTHILLSSLLDEDPEAWRAQLTEKRRKGLQDSITSRYMESPHLVANWLDLENHHNDSPAPLDMRLKLTIALMSDPMINQAYLTKEGSDDSFQSPFLRHFVQHHVLSPKEVAQNAFAFIEIGPGHQTTIAEVAEICLLADDPDMAVQIANRLADKSFTLQDSREKDGNNFRENGIFRSRARAINVLLNAGATDDAIALQEETMKFRFARVHDWREFVESLIKHPPQTVAE